MTFLGHLGRALRQAIERRFALRIAELVLLIPRRDLFRAIHLNLQHGRRFQHEFAIAILDDDRLAALNAELLADIGRQRDFPAGGNNQGLAHDGYSVKISFHHITTSRIAENPQLMSFNCFPPGVIIRQVQGITGTACKHREIDSDRQALTLNKLTVLRCQ